MRLPLAPLGGVWRSNREAIAVSLNLPQAHYTCICMYCQETSLGHGTLRQLRLKYAARRHGNASAGRPRLRRPSGVADAEDFLDRREQILGLKRLGEDEMRSRLPGRCKVGIGRYRGGLIARDAEVATPGYGDDADPGK